MGVQQNVPEQSARPGRTKNPAWQSFKLELNQKGRKVKERCVALQAVQPRFLSAKWEVDHSAAREFGPHSIYSAAAADDPGRGEWLQVADPSAYSAGLSSHNTAPHTAHSPSEAGQ